MQSNPAVRSPDAKDCPTARRIHRLGVRPACIAALLLLSIHVLAAEPRPAIVQSIDAKAARFTDVAQQIWSFAEVGYKEVKSSALLQEELRSAGFRVTAPVAGIPTAFTAEWGSGKPVIAILGEYDALPAMQQEAVPMRRPIGSRGPGHACGHNLFGAGSALAAVAVREWMEKEKIPGTIRFYGCPAEEGGSGKVFMVRAGLFADCDIALHWHPSDKNRAAANSCLGNIAGKFRFIGKAAHAAGAPEKGRSALDGVTLFNHAIDLLREHVPQTTRMHYIITQGGDAPNVVPAMAETYLYVRSPDMAVLADTWARVQKCAEGAAISSETTVSLEVISSAYPLLPNRPLAELCNEHLRRIGGVPYTDAETEFAQKLQATLTVDGTVATTPPQLGQAQAILPIEEQTTFGSTDVGDVSWAVPTGGFNTAAFVPGVPAHSWQSTACAGMGIGHKAMINASKVLALAAADLLTDPEKVRAARADFDQRRSGKAYQSLLPPDAKPPLNYRDK